jgi:hypothetical protein
MVAIEWNEEKRWEENFGFIIIKMTICVRVIILNLEGNYKK